MQIVPPLSEIRLQDPKRQAEIRVYQALAESPVPRHALYEIRAKPNSPDLDFPLWLESIGHLGLDVRGGPHVLEANGTFTRYDRNECTPNLSLRHHAWQAAIAFHEAIKEQLHRRIFIVPVLVLADMEPDQRIDAWAATGYVSALCGTHDLIPRLIDLAENKGCLMTPPTAQEIAEEVALFIPGPPMPGLPEKTEPAALAKPHQLLNPPAAVIAAEQVIIQHADVVNIYTPRQE